jgi:maltooligosyltrehalose trehalohydrolase
MDHSAEPRSHVRVWAPAARVVELATDDGRLFPLEPEACGYFAAELPGLGAGTRYRFRLDGDAFPDPASRFQPAGPHGSSMIVDPRAYEWGDNEWPGVSIDDAPVIYELHVGTFTRSGTFRDAIERLPDLVDVGVNVIEMMPVADFAGNFGWGYDGVNLFAPTRLYGEPDDLRAFVDAAHRLERGVILDVVYNHFGPDGNYVAKYSRRYMSDTRNEWGEALNFDGDDSGPVREFITSNARYWIEEFHFDGLRLDATQQIHDTSARHILADVADAVRSAARGRRTIVLGENEPQSTSLLRSPNNGGCGLDALWNDDFHHSARVAATGRNEAYFSGYVGRAQEFVSSAKYGFLYQGAWYAWQNQRRGTPALDVAPRRFVDFLQNHDQIANSGSGRRLHQETSAGRFRALTALLLLLPQTPMLFQGQEFAASSPFLYFADHTPELARLVREGRAKFVSQFPSMAARDDASRIEEPSDPWTFVRCKLDWAERRRHAHTLDLHRDLLRLRRDDPVLRRSRDRRVDGAVISERAFMIRYFGEGEGDRLLFINLGARAHADPLPEPLIVPPRGAEWRQIFSTESPEYGGWGAPKLETADDGWWLPAESATLLTSAP